MTSASLDSSLQVLSLLLVVTLVGRLTQLGLYRVYPFFFSSLCIPVVLQSVGFLYGFGSSTYFWCFAVAEPIRNILYILIVWELFSVIFRNYAGLRSLSRWVMGIAAGVALFGFVLSITASGSVFTGSVYIPILIRFERGVALGLVIFIIIMLFFISRYPIKLPRNSVVLCMLYSIWFLGDAGILLASSFISSPDGVRIINNVTAVFEVACYLGWTLMLSKSGEFQETRVRRELTPEHERVLIGELNAMNDLLLRAGRSISHTR